MQGFAEQGDSDASAGAARVSGRGRTVLVRLLRAAGLLLLLSTLLLPAMARAAEDPLEEVIRNHYIGTSLLSIPSWIPGDDILYLEIDYGYRVRAKDHIMVALDLYEYVSPMSAPWTDPLVYPGSVLSYGVVFAYQWYFFGDFFLMQMLNPLVLDYYGDDGHKARTGFMLLAATRLGYTLRFDLWDVPFYLELGVEVSYWPYNGNVPAAFKEVDDEYSSYAFSPSLSFGVEL